MIHILFGEDSAKKDQYLAELKNKMFAKYSSAISLDFELLFADKLPVDDLKKALWALPAVAPQRLIFVRDCHRLNDRHSAILEEFMQKDFPQIVLALESAESGALTGLIKRFRSKLKIVACEAETRPNVFDLTRMISMGKAMEALNLLHGLLKDGVHPLQVMGGIVWYWGKSREKMSRDVYHRGLLALKQADENIKRSRLDGARALELLIVKLSSPN